VSRLRKAAETMGELGTAGAVIAGCLVWGEDGRLSKFKIGPLAVFDRARMDARRAARAARKGKP